jgi:CheY-like chemotaxis protein
MEALGCSGYLLKPVKQQLLFDATLAVLGREKEESPALITRHILAEQKKLSSRLLLAEDNPINQKLAVTVLQKAGYSVDTVDNGADAVAKAKENPYSAILMDVQMPGTDGFEATQQIREWEKEQNIHIPIIAMTAHAMQGDRERCLAAGMDDYVTKPLQPNVLFSALNRWTQTEIAVNEQAKHVQDYSSEPDAFSMDFDDGMFGEVTPTLIPDPSPTIEKPDFFAVESLPVDLPAAIARFDDDRDFVLQILEDYRAQLPQRVQEIRELLQTGEATSLCRIAHNLKGVSLNISADPIAQAALGIEQSALREDLKGAADHLARLEIEVERFEDYLSRMNA